MVQSISMSLLFVYTVKKRKIILGNKHGCQVVNTVNSMLQVIFTTTLVFNIKQQ